eukprot:NODE_45_length_27728_cov_0.328387.p14 type:complete len:185 gc:universal NODE_45_length_27728_cov_0.328387:23415-22861(-)
MGKLIVVEGIDRSGKSTLVTRLTTHYQCHKSGFPNRSTDIGQLINKVLTKELEIKDKKALHLLFTANRWELQEEIKTMLMTRDVVLDRYIYSGIAYSVAQGIDSKWCSNVEQGLIIPDKIIYLDLSAKTSAARKGFGDELYEKQQFLELVTDSFKSLITEEWCIIDATQSLEEVFNKAVDFINK